MSFLFHTFLYNPIYNVLVSLVTISPHGDVGIAIIFLTILLRLILLPISLKTARTQRAMKILQPKLNEIKAKNKGNRQKEATETMALYKEKGVNPFSSLLSNIIPIIVFLALYLVFRYEPFPKLDTTLLYSITPLPHIISLQFLGIVSVAGKSIVLAVLAGIAMFFQAHFSLAGTQKPTASTGGTRIDFQRMMGMQMKFMFPILIGFFAYTLGNAVALYFIASNTIGFLQELYVRGKMRKEEAVGVVV